MAESKEAPWHAAYPGYQSAPGSITVSELKSKLEQGASVFVVDVRRTDFENGCIKGAINMPAHSFYPVREAAVKLLSSYELVVFHCNSCSAGGRGVRCASWFQDALDEQGITSSKAAILQGGIKAWLAQVGLDSELTTKLP